jgi:hypothetical protein
MGTLKKSAGFTIIEVMLFLAVSGALAIGVLATSTVGINNQRYQDAVNSFKAVVQEEFVNTTRVFNDRDASNTSCGGVEATVGASRCVIMGRLLTVDSSGAITRTNLIGQRGTGSEPDLDSQVITWYGPKIDTPSRQSDNINWGATPRRLQAPASFSIVILRSPSSGNVVAYTDTTLIQDDTRLGQFLSTASNSADKLMCIDPSGWTVAQMQGVVITARAAGPGGVEQRTVEDSECV